MSKSDNGKEEFIRVGTTLYKLANQPRLNGGYVKKRIVWNNETLRQDYGKHLIDLRPIGDWFKEQFEKLKQGLNVRQSRFKL